MGIPVLDTVKVGRMFGKVKNSECRWRARPYGDTRKEALSRLQRKSKGHLQRREEC